MCSLVPSEYGPSKQWERLHSGTLVPNRRKRKPFFLSLSLYAPESEKETQETGKQRRGRRDRGRDDGRATDARNVISFQGRGEEQKLGS